MPQLNDIFAALADDTRRQILSSLMHGESKLSELAKLFPMSQTGVSKHVRVLEEAGLLEVEKRGRTRFCRLNSVAMKQASDWLAGYESFWLQQLEQLSVYVRNNGSDS